MIRSIVATGDVTDPRCWSGTPYHFWRAALAAGFATHAWRLDLDRLKWQRRGWNASRLLLTGSIGGFQYSTSFLDQLEGQVPGELWSGEILSFNPHLPRIQSVKSRGGQLNHYLDAPFVALASGRGLPLRLPPQVVKEAIAAEAENLHGSERIITMARWAAKVVQEECGVPASKVHVILPGANLDLPENWDFPTPLGRAGKDRDFVLGFIGVDWKRKGLPLLLSVREFLVRRGWKVSVLSAGNAPNELRNNPDVEFAGFIDKRNNSAAFLRLLSRCDLGCLFSEQECLGISTLEFLRAGVPVAGFAHEGMDDTLPPDAGFRFPFDTRAEDIADRLDLYLQDEMEQHRLRESARKWSEIVTWERCLREFHELWDTGSVTSPVQPWRGRTIAHK